MSILGWFASLAVVTSWTSITMAAFPCDSSAHRAFDFWIGEWQVHTPDDLLAGTNRITWIPNADGSVRQLLKSTDQKGPWRAAFDGRYTRR